MHKLISLLRNIITGGIQEGFEHEKIRKITVLNLFSFLGMLSMIYFGLTSYVNGHISHAIILLITMLITLSSFIYLRLTHNHKITGHFIINLMIALNIYLFLFSGNDKSGILWLYVFPILAMYTIGSKKGLIYISFLFSIIIISLYGNFAFTPKYSDDLRQRFIATFTVVTLMSLIFERVRAKTYSELQKHKQNLEQIVYERTLELEKAKEKAEESDRLKSSFLANMSHEIRTPLNAIVGFTNLIASSNTDNELKQDMANHVMANSNSLIRLIEDIIDISKIDSGQFSLNISNFNLRKVIDDILFDYQEKMQLTGKKHLNLVKNIPQGNDPLLINSDSGRLTQIISHLLDNALKFTDEGQIEFGFSPIRENSITFYIRDTGIGFTKEEGDKIFERFITGKVSRQRIYRGTGLGLSICKSLITMLGGSIWYESQKNLGSTFYFSINTNLQLTEKSIKTSSIFTAKEDNFENLTILIAEDEESNYKYLKELLAHTNATILHASNGKQAVDMVDLHKIDLILMDIKMPIMNGLEATKLIKATNNKIPIVAQTAFTLEMNEKVSVDSGCDAYIAKPINKQRLIALISDLIKK